jgi:hypothetical protein
MTLQTLHDTLDNLHRAIRDADRVRVKDLPDLFEGMAEDITKALGIVEQLMAAGEMADERIAA